MPLNLNNNEVTGVDLNNTEVSEVRLNGQTVFQAVQTNPISESRSMFNNAVYHYTANSFSALSDGQQTGTWNSLISGSQATPESSNEPVYRFQEDIFTHAVEGTSSHIGYEFSLENRPTNEMTLAATVKFTNLGRNNFLLYYGRNAVAERIMLLNSGSSLQADLFGAGGSNATGGTLVENQIHTVGFRMRNDGFLAAFIDGVEVASDNDNTASLATDNRFLMTSDGGDGFEGIVYDMVISNSFESSNTMIDYHNDRI